MRTLAQDVTYALRTLVASPGFAAAAILSLALGIGANTAIFTLTDAVFLNPLPVEEPSRVIEVYTVDHLTKTTNNLGRTGSSWMNFMDIRDQNQVFSGISAYTFSNVSITGRGEPKPETAQLVTANYFDVLGVGPFLGRAFLPEEDRKPTPVAILSYSLSCLLFGIGAQDPATFCVVAATLGAVALLAAWLLALVAARIDPLLALRRE
jgi:putative ABC transport system permease protein